MVETKYGSRYEATKDLDISDVAKLIRADIKAQVGRLLPRAKYSVRIERYAGGQSINVIAAAETAHRDFAVKIVLDDVGQVKQMVVDDSFFEF